MSKVKGRRKPLHSEITSLRRPKKAAVVEATAPEVAVVDAADTEEPSPDSEVGDEALTEESLAEAAQSALPGAVEAKAAVEPEPTAGDSEPETGTEIGSPAEEDFDGLSIESLASVEEDPELTETQDPEPESALSEAFEPNQDRDAPSNVVSIDGDEPDDMEAYLCGLIEALLFTSQKPLPLKDLARSAGIDRPRARELVERLMRNYAPHGINIEEVAGGYVLRSSARYAPQIQKFLSLRPVRLSRAQLETLAIVAYRQPVTKPEVDDIRGVDSGQVLKGLLERDLLKTLGKKDEPGRPMLYGTTNDFLELLNLRSLGELPTLREYTELSDESKRKFAEETGEEAPNELPIGEAAASDTLSAEAVPPAEGTAPEGPTLAQDPTSDVSGSDELPASAVAFDAEPVAPEGEADEALDGESASVEPPLGELAAAQPDEDESDPAEDEDDEDDDDADEDDADEDDFDDDDFDDEDEDEDDDDADEEKDEEEDV